MDKEKKKRNQRAQIIIIIRRRRLEQGLKRENKERGELDMKKMKRDSNRDGKWRIRRQGGRIYYDNANKNNKHFKWKINNYYIYKWL